MSKLREIHTGSNPVLMTKIKDMFRTLIYIWRQFLKRPSKRRFLIFTKMLRAEIKFLIMTGHSTDELIK